MRSERLEMRFFLPIHRTARAKYLQQPYGFQFLKKMFCLISWDIWRIDILFHTVTANGAMCCVQSHVSDSETPWQPARLLCPWDFPVKNTGWSGLPFPSRGDILEPQTELASSCTAGRFFTTESPGKPSISYAYMQNWQRENENH